MRKEWFCWNI